MTQNLIYIFLFSSLWSTQTLQDPTEDPCGSSAVLGFGLQRLASISVVWICWDFFLRVIFTMLTLTVFGAGAVEVSGFFHIHMVLKNQTIYATAWKKQKASCLRTFL